MNNFKFRFNGISTNKKYAGLMLKIMLLLVLSVFLLTGIYQLFAEKTDNRQADILEELGVIKPPADLHTIVIKDDTVWTGGRDGVFMVDVKSAVLLGELKEKSSFKYVQSLCFDNIGRLWIGHEDGLTVYDGKSFRTFSDKDGLPDKRVNSVIQDVNGDIWAGTWGGAALIRKDKVEKVLTQKDGLLDNMVNVVFEDKKGGIWFGSKSAPRGGLSCYKDGSWQYFSTKNGLPHNNVTSITEDTKGNVWAGTGLYDMGGAANFVYTGGKWALTGIMSKKDGLAGEKVRSLFFDDSGAVFIGSEYDGLSILNGGKTTTLTTRNGLSNNEVKAMAKDKNGRIWLATMDGITWLKLKDNK